ncbi:heparinase II/III family protein [Nitrincola tibetensis]|uniref:heparinase II/III family protein n=1 Tax=Nitrincola tibetensis TaxID=2219697 RepID=UPI0010576C1B|nr:heparinase II/III family protein [Nitrincola tibetensis]
MLTKKELGSISLKCGASLLLKFCVQEKLLLLSTNSSNKLLGEKLFSKNCLELAPFKSVQFFEWGDWEQNPLKNRSWQWRLNWLSFLPYLIAYHRASGDEAVLDSALEAIQSWLKTYLETDNSYPFEFIWHDHATALRAEQLVFFTYYCHEFAPAWAKKHSDFLTYLEQALMVHGQWLAEDSFYSHHTNHGLEQARVLLLLGTVFEGEQSQKWLQIAIKRISSELEFAFTEEGVHVENSPAYHIFVFKVFLGIIKDYPEEVLGDLAQQFNQFSAKALSFVTNILRPDGRLPPIGDTEQLPTSDGYKEMFGHRLEYQYFLYSHTQGKQGVKPPILNKVYPKSGYAIFRNEWPAKEHYQKAFHLIVKVGCSSRYHHQQDEGHISLYAGGEDWLIDSGLYNYINNDPVRKYMRGRPGHNVPIISHASYSKEFEHRLSAWKVSEFSESDTKPHIKMQLDVLAPVSHERTVTFDSQTKIVEVQDKISADDKQSRNITLQWHFPKDKTLSINNNQVLVTSDSGNQLAIEFEGDTPDDLSVVSGRKEDRVFSCISYKANQVEPSQLLRVVFRVRNQLNVTTRFQFKKIS